MSNPIDTVVSIKEIEAAIKEFASAAMTISYDVGLEVAMAVLDMNETKLQTLLMSVFCTGAVCGVVSQKNPEEWAKAKAETEEYLAKANAEIENQELAETEPKNKILVA